MLSNDIYDEYRQVRIFFLKTINELTEKEYNSKCRIN